MMIVVLITFALLVSAVAAATAIGWHRRATAPVRVEARIEGPTCTPRVKR